MKTRALAAAFFDSRAERAHRFGPHSESEWEDLIRAGSEERVLPALGRRLKELHIEVEAPPEAGDFLAAVEEMNRERNARILDEARSIAGTLNGIGIEPVFLKGAAYLIDGVYPDTGCRYLCDLDLLVPASRLAAAAEVLEHEGYLPDMSDDMARFRHHHPQLQRPRGANGSGSAPVELHHSLGHGLSQRLLSGEEILDASRLLEWRGARVRVPSPEHLATHLILHSQIHHTYSERIWPPPRAMYDLAMLNRRYGGRLDWAAVRGRFRQHGQESTLLLHLLQVNDTLGMPAPFAFRQGWVMRARWMRRRALNQWPALRFIDPVYLCLSALSRRIGFLRSIVMVPGGLKHAIRVLLQRGFYRRLLAEISLR